MEDENKNKIPEEPLFEKEALQELSENSVEKKRLLDMAGIVLGLSFLMIIHNFYSIFKMMSDDSIPLVHCPRSFDMDRPVLLKRIYETKLGADNMVRGFSINYVRSLFPRAVEDFEPFTNYVVDHSEGYIQKRYEARLKEKKVITGNIDTGIFSKFWIADSQKIQIRAVEGKEGSWKVIIFGYLHKRASGGNFEKLQPRIELIVKAIPATITNPEGLIVSDILIKQIKDPISGSEIEI